MAIQWTPEELASMRRWDRMIDSHPRELTEQEKLSAEIRDAQVVTERKVRTNLEKKEAERQKGRNYYEKNKEKIKAKKRAQYAAMSPEEKTAYLEYKKKRRQMGFVRT